MSFGKIVMVLVSAAALWGAPASGQEAVGVPEEAIRTNPAVVEQDAKAAIVGVNTFSLDLYRRTLFADENHFLSPASVSVAIGLAYRGARGTTAAQLEKVLHFGKMPRDYLRINGQVLETMSIGGPRRELRTAKVFVRTSRSCSYCVIDGPG